MHNTLQIYNSYHFCFTTKPYEVTAVLPLVPMRLRLTLASDEVRSWGLWLYVKLGYRVLSHT